VTDALTVALPKGRVLRAVAPLLSRVGVDVQALLADDRTLMREAPAAGLRFLLLKPDDVPTYVEYGAADLGVCGRDVLMERTADLYQPLDLQLGICRMVVAGLRGRAEPKGVPRVATKYPRNPNGSPFGIAALTNTDGRVTITMPHPERSSRYVQNSWHPKEVGEHSGWTRLFRNARKFVG